VKASEHVSPENGDCLTEHQHCRDGYKNDILQTKQNVQQQGFPRGHPP
jgi:hypothetical protein